MTTANGILDAQAIGEVAGIPQLAPSLSALTGVNLFNADAADVLLGYYVANDGTPLLSNSGGSKYHLSGFIPILPSTLYTKTGSGMAAFYAASGAYISIASPPSLTFTTPANAAYVRVGVLRTDWSSFQLGIGITAPWVPYGNRQPTTPVNPFNPQYLRRSRMLLMNRAIGVATQIIINAAGDSYTFADSRWTGAAAQYLAAQYGDAGGGWCGFGFLTAGTPPYTFSNQPTNYSGNVRSATYPTRILGSPTATYYTKATPDLASLTLSATGDGAFQAFPATPVHNGCDLFFVGTSNGVVKVTWGTYTSGDVADPASYSFGSSTNYNVQGTVGATQIVDIKSGMPSGAGAVKIEWVSGTAEISGVNLKSAASGVRFNKIAATGSYLQSYVGVDATNWQNAMTALGGDIFIYMDGPNSQAAGRSATLWGNDLETLMRRLRTALPASDRLFAAPPENQRTTNTVPIMAYAREAKLRASRTQNYGGFGAGGFAFHDTQYAFGDPGNPTEYGSAGICPLFNADLLHPEPATGGKLLAQSILQALAA